MLHYWTRDGHAACGADGTGLARDKALVDCEDCKHAIDLKAAIDAIERVVDAIGDSSDPLVCIAEGKLDLCLYGVITAAELMHLRLDQID